VVVQHDDEECDGEPELADEHAAGRGRPARDRSTRMQQLYLAGGQQARASSSSIKVRIRPGVTLASRHAAVPGRRIVWG
jgi:hypothetical protein